jgi:predicted dehydrogenase
MKIAIIGAAGHHHLALDAMEKCPDIALVGVAPGCPGEDISALAKAGAPMFEDYRSLIVGQNPDVAVVNPWFADAAGVSVECLKRGVHVYSEKPLATTREGLRALEDAWRASGRALGGMFNYRYAPWFWAMKAAVDAGEIGTVRMAHGQKSYRLGVRPEFYKKRALMGGIIPWVAIHAIDWVLAFLGNCEWVSATHSAAFNRGNGELEVTSALLMGMEEGGIGTVTADFLRPDGSARHDDDRLRLTGTKGMIEVADGRVFLENDAPRRELTLPPPESAFLGFLAAAESGTAEQFALPALAATRVSLAARDSADAGGARVTIK